MGVGLMAVIGAPRLLVAQAPSPPPHFAIRNGRIITGTGKTISGGTIVMDEGLITAVGRNVTIPADAWVIDGSGLTVYPESLKLSYPSVRSRDGRALRTATGSCIASSHDQCRRNLGR